MNFKHFDWRERHSQDFDRENITLTKAGTTYNVYDKIQEAREDTEIYPTLEKYGCIDKMILNTNDIYGDFTEFKDLRSMHDQQIKANEMFYKLPLEVRQHFNNNISQFMQDGENWLKQQMQPKEEPKQEELNLGDKENG